MDNLDIDSLFDFEPLRPEAETDLSEKEETLEFEPQCELLEVKMENDDYVFQEDDNIYGNDNSQIEME